MDAKHHPPLAAAALRAVFGAVALLACALLLGFALAAAPDRAWAVDYGDYNGDGSITQEQAQKASDIQPEVYEALGLTISPDIPEDAVAPFPENRAFDVISKREVYMSANGAAANKYVVRDRLDYLGPSSAIPKKGEKTFSYTNDGAHWGAYKLWDINKDNRYIYESSGGTTESYLASNNDKVVLKTEGAGFDGKYATSVAFSAKKGDDACDDHVAELRAYNSNCTQKYRGNGEWYNGLIEISIFSFDADGKRNLETELLPTLHESQFIATDGYHELNYVNFGYYQEYEGYFEIEAADVDGDGIDELFAYTGAYEDRDGKRYAIVYLFRSTDGKNWDYKYVYLDTGAAANYVTLDELKEKNPDPKKHAGANLWRWQLARMAPVVTIAAGDLDRNGTEEVLVTTSAPVGHKDAAAAAHARMFHWDETAGNVVTVEGLEDIALSGADGKALTSANCASGTFLLPKSSYTYSVTGFVVAGWQTNDKTCGPNGAWKQFGYRYLYFDPSERTYVVSDYQAHALGKDAQIIANSAARKTGGDGRYMVTMAPFPLGCARLETLANGTTGDYVLAGGDIYRFDLGGAGGGGMGLQVDSLSLFSDHTHLNSTHIYEQDKPKDHIWIGDVVSGYVADDGYAHDSFLAVVGVRRDDDVRGSDDYYWFDVAHYTFEAGNPAKKCTGQEGVIKESTRMGKASGPNISLSLPDIDNDSVRMRLLDKAVFPTAPQVLAVLQDTPYFGDLQDTYHYLSDSNTSFGKGSDTSTSNGFYLDLAVGGHWSMSWGEGPAVQFDAALKGAIGYSQQWTDATGHSVTYTANGGSGNKVVAYVVPMYYYWYEVYNPEKGEWEDGMQTMAGDPVTTVVSVEAWDSVAKGTKTLPIIGADPDNLGAALGNVSGRPDTYTGTSMAGERFLDSGQTTSVSTGLGEGAFVTQQVDMSKSVTKDLSLGLQINVTTGFGFGLLGSKTVVGPVVDFDAGYGHSSINTESTVFYGAVDNLPTLRGVAANSGKYAFDWKLVVNRLQHSKEDKDAYKKEHKRPLDDVYLVGYEVGADSLVAPGIPMVGDARIDRVSDSSVTLSWSPVDFGKAFDDKTAIYRVGVLASNDSGEVAQWFDVDANAHPTDWDTRIERAVTGLSPKTRYQFVVVGARVTKGANSVSIHSSSIPSPTLSATTLEVGESIKITRQPQELDVLQKGDTARYTVGAAWGTAAGDRSDDIAYTWQYWDVASASWVELGDGRGNSTIEVGPFSDDEPAASAVGAPSASSTGVPAAAKRVAIPSSLLAFAPGEGGRSASRYSTAGKLSAAAGIGLADWGEALRGYFRRAAFAATPSFTLGSDAGQTESTLVMNGVARKQNGMLLRCNVGFGQQLVASSEVEIHVQTEEAKPVVSEMPPAFVTKTSAARALWFEPAVAGAGEKRLANGDGSDDGGSNGNGNNGAYGGGNDAGYGGNNAVPSTRSATSSGQAARATAKTADDESGFAYALLLCAAAYATFRYANRRVNRLK